MPARYPHDDKCAQRALRLHCCNRLRLKHQSSRLSHVLVLPHSIIPVLYTVTLETTNSKLWWCNSPFPLPIRRYPTAKQRSKQPPHDICQQRTTPRSGSSTCVLHGGLIFCLGCSILSYVNTQLEHLSREEEFYLWLHALVTTCCVCDSMMANGVLSKKV